MPLPEDEIGAVDAALSPKQHAAYRHLCHILRTQSPCLVFVNSRSDAETLSTRLQAMAPDLKIGVHHGSLATETRQQMEDELREGVLSGLVCTSSLELGIDVGSVRRIVQVHSPKSVDRMLQRVGVPTTVSAASGEGTSSRGTSTTCSSRRSWRSEPWWARLNRWCGEERPGIIAANQLVLMAHCFKAVSIDEATRLLAAAPQFEGWQRADTEAMLQVLAERWVLRFTPVPSEVPWYRWPKAVYQVAERKPSLEARTSRRLAALQHAGRSGSAPLHRTNGGRSEALCTRLVVHRRQRLANGSPTISP